MNQGDLWGKVNLFEELRANESTPFDSLPEEVQVYVSHVDPKHCRNLMKELACILPLLKSDGFSKSKALTDNDDSRWPKLGHLRRIHRTQHPHEAMAAETSGDNAEIGQSEENSTTKTEKKKIARHRSNSVSLRILVGSVEQVDCLMQDNTEDSKTPKLKQLIRNYKLDLVKEKLPGRPAKTRVELDQWNARNEGTGWWPTLFFEKQTTEFKDKELELNLDDQWGMMRNGMLAAVEDSRMFKDKEMLIGKLCGSENNICGAVVVCPTSQKIVSTAFKEWQTQVSESQEEEIKEKDTKLKMRENPLSTSVLLAIQGVSRSERRKALGHGMNSESFRNGQYLCTGYDIYVTKEPGIFEAMALIHSRIRRVIFLEDNSIDGGLGGTGNETSVHRLLDTNHHYRVFRYFDSLTKYLYNEA